jgi:glycosyltransferase involved in cell wall biosynthesis
MKVYLNSANESWVVDRFREEWVSNNEFITTDNIKEADIVWIIAPWTWKKIPKKYLKSKIVVCTIHHIDKSKFDNKEKKNFYKRDNFVNFYHAISSKTEEQLEKLVSQRIFTIPFWVNQNIFYEMKNKKMLKKKYNIPEDSFLVGSFQRDTEGKDLTSPKLSKGPDQFMRIMQHYKERYPNLRVLLTGKRRQYLIQSLKDSNIPFNFFEMTTFAELNELYNCLDLYLVTSRVEGGPQALVECGLTKTPLISTDVGLASYILDKSSIFSMDNYQQAQPNTLKAYENSSKLIIPEWFNKYKSMFEEIL